MSQDFVKYGGFNITFPDASFNTFSIFEDLTEIFGVEYQSEAVSILKQELKNLTDIKPRPSIDYEADRTSIHSRNAETMFKVAEMINCLVVDGFHVALSENERKVILEQMRACKRPKKQKWSVGDVFSMELTDGTFMFGQIIDTGLSKGCAVLAGFELRKTVSTVSVAELEKSRIISIFHATCECLEKGKFSILINAKPIVVTKTVNKFGDADDYFRAYISKSKAIVNKYFSTEDGVLLNLCNVYYGLEPWNVLGKEDHYDKMLLAHVQRPKTALILNTEARNKYRLEHFGINENNEYVNKKRS